MSARTNVEALGLVAGFGVWSLAFVALYGAHGAACALGWTPGAARIVLAALLIAHLIAHAALIVWFGRRWRAAAEDAGGVRAVRGVSLVLAIGAMGATIWTGLPALALRICL